MPLERAAARHHHPHHWRLKERERNLLAAVLSIVVIATLSTALVHPRWFYLQGGGCGHKYLGVQNFFYVGYFEAFPRLFVNGPSRLPSYIYYGWNEVMKDCVTPTIVSLQRVLIVLCFLAILSSLLQFFMDALGVTYKWLRVIRRNAFCSIVTVGLCLGVVGTCYYISTLMEVQQEMTKPSRSSRVEVSFSVSYHLVAAAGAAAVLAAGANLLARPVPVTQLGDSAIDSLLLDDDFSRETFVVGISHSEMWPYRQDLTRLHSLPPLPPYSP
uniref:Putative conserved plasma membrane protein n=2 Tax=Amblyomma TaxID=6942 RepID=A0A1E1XDF0_9ACAR